MPRLASTVVWLSILGCAGCHIFDEKNSLSCELPENRTMADCAIGPSCDRDEDCMGMPGLLVCDTIIGHCVQCTMNNHNACMNPTPACVNDICQMCTSNSQCSSRACLLTNGTCADAADVAYVRPSGSGAACTDSAPCKTLTDGLNAGKAIVKVEGNITDDSVATATTSVTILADAGSQVTRSSNGIILDVKNDQADVKVYDLRITGGMGAKGDIAVSVSGGSTPKLALTRVQVDTNVGIGISVTAGTLTVTQSTITGNGAQGILAMNSTLTMTEGTISGNSAQGISAMNSTLTNTQCTITGNSAEGISAMNSTLTNTQCTISKNSAVGVSTMDTALNMSRSTISENAGGGIAINNGSFDITNNFIASNGPFGGVNISNVNTGTRRFEFNTVTDNNAPAGKTTGVFCMGIMPTSLLTLSNNIVFDNQIGSSRTQIGGNNCIWTYSDIGDSSSTTTITDLMGNKNVDPLFKDVVGKNYHLKPDSPVKDAADPVPSTIKIDFDSDTRPQGNRSDMGADEIVPLP